MYDKFVHVWKVFLSQEPYELLTNVSYDVSMVSATSLFSLMITSRGSVVAQLEKEDMCRLNLDSQLYPCRSVMGVV